MLRHFECGQQVYADVEVQHDKCAISNKDDSWDLGEFEAHIDLDAVGEWATIRVVQCECDARIEGTGLGSLDLELVTG